MKTLVIPSSVTSIEYRAFSGCKGLTSVYASWYTPPFIDATVFDQVNKDKCTLYVPQGSTQRYKKSGAWDMFKNIVEYDPTGISKPALSSDIKEVYRSTANGQLLKAPAKGLNIVKYSDGSARKEMVR